MHIELQRGPILGIEELTYPSDIYLLTQAIALGSEPCSASLGLYSQQDNNI